MAPAVAVVSEAMARRYWGTSDVVGRRYRSRRRTGLVGGDRRRRAGREGVEPHRRAAAAVLSIADQQGWPSVSFIVGATAISSRWSGTLSRVVHEVDRALPILQASTMDDYLAQQLLIPRIGASILAGFSLAALVLAALGLYAVVAFAVGERAREVGIRMALGARGPHVVWMTMRGVMMTVGVGLAVGIVLALGAAQGMSARPLPVSPTDPATLAMVTVTLARVAAVAALIPARRATRVDPSVVLRYRRARLLDRPDRETPCAGISGLSPTSSRPPPTMRFAPRLCSSYGS